MVVVFFYHADTFLFYFSNYYWLFLLDASSPLNRQLLTADQFLGWNVE